MEATAYGNAIGKGGVAKDVLCLWARHRGQIFVA